jgi:hypothetical protein
VLVDDTILRTETEFILTSIVDGLVRILPVYTELKGNPDPLIVITYPPYLLPETGEIYVTATGTECFANPVFISEYPIFSI